MVNKYAQSQVGGSLILVLFIILFLSIIGTAMLNQTFYSQKSIVKNAEVQAEFYKAEGAIDLLLFEMNGFVEHPPVLFLNYEDGEPVLDENNEQVPIVRSGPYYYLDFGAPRLREFTIGGEIFEVSITNIEHKDLGENQKQYDFTLVSKSKSSPSFTREVIMTTIIEEKSGIIDIIDPGEEAYPYFPPFPGNANERINYLNSKNVHSNAPTWDAAANKPINPNTNWESFLTFYGLKNNIPVLLPSYSSNSPSNPFKLSDNIYMYDSITGSGTNLNLVIDKGNLTFARTVEFTGCGNGNIEISGVLIAETVSLQGSCNYIISGGIITKNFKIGSPDSSTKLVARGSGFDEDGGAGEYTPPREPVYSEYTLSDYQWSSIVNDVTNYETKR
jgi:hypothetical protein